MLFRDTVAVVIFDVEVSEEFLKAVEEFPVIVTNSKALQNSIQFCKSKEAAALVHKNVVLVHDEETKGGGLLEVFNLLQVHSVKYLVDWKSVITTKGFQLLFQIHDKPVADLYWVNGSVPSWKVMNVLHYLNIPYHARRLRVMCTPKETRSEQFLALNPRGKTPTWVEPDGTVLYESMAIMWYLNEKFGKEEKSLLPFDAVNVGVMVARMNEAETLRLNYDPIELLFNKELTEEQVDRVKAAYQKTMTDLTIWDTYLDEKEYLLGERFTLADCSFHATISYLVRRGLNLSEFRNVKRYYETLNKFSFIQQSRPILWKNTGFNLFRRCEQLLKI